MKKKSKPNQKSKRTRATTAPAPQPKITRRAAMSYLQYGILGAVLVGGVGAYAVTSVMASVAEQDLSVIGQGTPTIVQIHDPQCPDCTALQRETRAALDTFDDGAVEFRIASLVSTDGQAFAREYGVGRVTLMLFDSAGDVVDVMSGTRTADQLARRFETLVSEER